MIALLDELTETFESNGKPSTIHVARLLVVIFHYSRKMQSFLIPIESNEKQKERKLTLSGTGCDLK